MNLIFDIKRYAINDGPGIPKAFVTEKTNYTQPRNALAVELV